MAMTKQELIWFLEKLVVRAIEEKRVTGRKLLFIIWSKTSRCKKGGWPEWDLT